MNRFEYLRAVSELHARSQPLPRVLPSASPVRSFRLGPPEDNRRPPWFEELVDITGAADAFAVRAAIVHGSFGDGTAITYSDLDLTLLVDEQELAHEDAVRRMNRWISRQLFPLLVRVDPLQHHGPFFLWDSFSQNYSEHVLPSTAYSPERAWSTAEIELSFRSCEDEPSTSLSVDCAARLSNPRRGFFRYGFDLYSVKRFVSNATLLPAYFMTDMGAPVHKAASFAAFYDMVGHQPELLRIAEEVRSAWPEPPMMLRRAAALASRSRFAYRGVHLTHRATELRPQVTSMAHHAAGLIPVLEGHIGTSR